MAVIVCEPRAVAILLEFNASEWTIMPFVTIPKKCNKFDFQTVLNDGHDLWVIY